MAKSTQMKAWWDALPVAEQEHRREQARDAGRVGKAVVVERYPGAEELRERTRQAIESGEIVPGPCDRCGGPGEPLHSLREMRLVGWRCFPCRK